ncbi:MAG: 2-hydroxyacyl-CoA dehydratase family protein, partial [Azospirillaceae bacterium]
MGQDEAREALEAAFQRREVPPGAAEPAIGVFGNGLPEALVRAAGFLPVDVKLPTADGPAPAVPAIAGFCEDFLDDHARDFLNRLFAGAHAPLAAIIFCRDDQAAMSAYQYAVELRRLGRGGKAMPKLLLWNLVHGEGAAIARFNRAEAERLFGDLAALGGRRPDADALRHAQQVEARRAAALARLQALRGEGPSPISGGAAMRWRNAGRFLTAEQHASLLEAALAGAGRQPASADRTGRPRVGLTGSATASPALYAVIERHGDIVADSQAFGDVWPGAGAGAEDLDHLLAAEAADPLHPRGNPPGRRHAALVD